MIHCKGYAAPNSTEPLTPFQFKRRSPGIAEICIKVLYCGVCHSDVFMAKSKWGFTVNYPCVPGHEIVGEVIQTGDLVKKFKPGDYAAVGCYVDSCGICTSCLEHQEQHCKESKLTYNSFCEKEGYTKGGYSTHIVLNESFAFTIPTTLHTSLARVAPLLCAGITVYSPMMRHKMYFPGKKIGVVGLGGLGHMAVKFAKSFNNEVTVISRSTSKAADSKTILKADKFLCSADPSQMASAEGSLDYIVFTAPASADMNRYLKLLAVGGVLVMVAIPPSEDDTFPVSVVDCVMKGKVVCGSLVGGNTQIQEMLNYCGQHHLLPEIEMVKMNKINDVFHVLETTGAVKYRYVIDVANSSY